MPSVVAFQQTVQEITVLSCQEASRLASQALDQALTLRERLGLRLHQTICSGCRGFARQLQHIRRACRRIEESEGVNVKTEALSATAKARILQEITVKHRARE